MDLRIARYRETISAIPPIARYVVFGVSTWPSGCDTLSFLSSASSPLKSMRSEGAIPQKRSKDYLSDTRAIPYKNPGKWVQKTPPLQYYLKGVLRDMGGYLALRRKRPATGVSRALQARSVPESDRENRLVSAGPFRDFFQTLECRESVPRLSPECLKRCPPALWGD